MSRVSKLLAPLGKRRDAGVSMLEEAEEDEEAAEKNVFLSFLDCSAAEFT